MFWTSDWTQIYMVMSRLRRPSLGIGGSVEVVAIKTPPLCRDQQRVAYAVTRRYLLLECYWALRFHHRPARGTKCAVGYLKVWSQRTWMLSRIGEADVTDPAVGGHLHALPDGEYLTGLFLEMLQSCMSNIDPITFETTTASWTDGNSDAGVIAKAFRVEILLAARKLFSEQVASSQISPGLSNARSGSTSISSDLDGIFSCHKMHHFNVTNTAGDPLRELSRVMGSLGSRADKRETDADCISRSTSIYHRQDYHMDILSIWIKDVESRIEGISVVIESMMEKNMGVTALLRWYDEGRDSIEVFKELNNSVDWARNLLMREGHRPASLPQRFKLCRKSSSLFNAHVSPEFFPPNVLFNPSQTLDIAAGAVGS
ncbi:hypothetical protein E6O75_ATG00984 [Venturia nashicola]|uniref:Uncharacterized protein n=1 Tax=Venturia nashicola TaxID=86259 RepID=A0A4Z1PKT9_9PEZI|nr:hypothetical protein E6O75_ATG00984 [Venturia nashicola]